MTPTQELILDCLAARARLGEQLYTFDNRLSKTAQKLEADGLIVIMSGNVENTFRAYLTDAGRAAAMSPTYASPLEAEIAGLKRRVSMLQGELFHAYASLKEATT